MILSYLLNVTLGEISFALCGLQESHLALLRPAWGPFIGEIRSYTKDYDDGLGFNADYVIRFFEGSAPDDIQPLYQRGSDVVLATGASIHRRTVIHSWVDGSLGALEATVQVILQWALAQEGGLLMHASAGVYQSQGWLIPGVSGAGKSTAVREGGFDIVLSDEMVIVKPTRMTAMKQQAYRLFSTPFWSEGRMLPLIVADARLDLLAFPLKSEHAQLLPCSATEAVTLFMRAVTAYERLGPEASRLKQHSHLFEHACRVVESTPYRLLAFPKYGPWRALLSHA